MRENGLVQICGRLSGLSTKLNVAQCRYTIFEVDIGTSLISLRPSFYGRPYLQYMRTVSEQFFGLLIIRVCATNFHGA